MVPRPKHQSFPWLPIGLVVFVVVVGLVAMVRGPASDLVQTPAEAVAKVGLTQLGGGSSHPGLHDEVALLDPTPLFLPTRWNTGRSAPLEEAGREPGAALGNFPPNLVFSQDDPNIRFPAAVAVPAGPVAALRPGQGSGTYGALARADVELSPLNPRMGFLKVLDTGTGALIWSAELPKLEPAAGIPEAPDLWAPVELLVAVSPGGLVGLPILTASSGSESWDNWVPRFLAGTYHLGARLPPGIYRIHLGP